MTEHLSEANLVDVAERGLAGPPAHDAGSDLERVSLARARLHLETCERCRTLVEEARATLRLAVEVPVPEPPAGFWDELSRRVRKNVEAERSVPIAGGWRWWLRVGLVPAAAALVIVAALLWQAGGSTDGNPRSAAFEPSIEESLDTDEVSDLDFWGVLTSEAARDVDFETALAAGLSFGPGSAEAAAAQLNENEQRELVRLLQEAVEQLVPE